MRPTPVGAIGSSHYVRLTGKRARVLVVASSIGLMFGSAQPAAAASDLQSEPQYITSNEISLQPGPGMPPSVGAARGAMVESAPVVSAASTAYSEKYWAAFSDADLNALHTEARTDPETRFAGAMDLLAGGFYDQAERALVEVSKQVSEINVAVASRIMLASILRYQHKWTELRDLPLTSPLPTNDNTLTNDLEQWGKAFAGAPDQTIQFPDGEITLPLRLTALGTPTVRVRINGKDYDFWLDTGSTMTVISSEVAEAAGSTVLSPEVLAVKTFGGTAPVRATVIKSLEIGPVTISNSPAVIIDASSMYLRTSSNVGSMPTGITLDGIIGWDVIRHFDMTMNYADRKITLRQPVFRGNGRGNLVWLARPLVEVSSRSGDKLHFTLDTGAQGSFLNATVLGKSGAVTKGAGTRVYGLAHTGKEINRVIPVLELDVAGKGVALQNVILYGPVESGLINCDGILGSDIARFGSLHIDATNGVFSVGQSDGEDATE